MSREEIISTIKDTIESDPNKKYIKSVSLFGSLLHGDDRPDSDIDLLYETNGIMSLFKSGGMQYRLQEKLGRKVDFIEKDSLDKYIKDEVLAEAKKIL